MKPFIVLRGGRLACACALACAAAGCTIAGQIQDNKNTQTRVDQKTIELEQEEVQQQQLERETQELNVDLGSKQVTAEQLDERLAALQTRNQQLAHANDNKSRQRAELARVLADYRAKVKALRAANAQADAQGAAEQVAQQQKLDSLTQQLRARLASMTPN